MAEAIALTSLRARTIAHSARQFFRSSKLRIAVIFALALSFWALMFCMFLEVFTFLARFEAVRGIVIDYLFAFFFLALLAMMTISNGIISYTSLFRSEETSFLLSLPLPAETVFSYKSAESVVFSSWGMVTLVVPLMLAYGLTSSVPWYFYVLSFALAVTFVFLPTELGALAALLVTVLLPRRRKTVLAAGVVAALVAGFLWVLPLFKQDKSGIFSEAAIRSVIQRIAFCQHWALPSRWVSEGMLSSAHADPGRALFLLLLLLSNVIFVGIVAYRVGHYLYPKAWAVAQGQGSKRKYAPFWWLDSIFEAMLFFLPTRIRLLVLKDVKTFRRDPVQWSQCLLFFGLLALYIVNIPRFGLGGLGAYWHNLVSLLNLAATCLTLSTLTSRFIYPQLSLEGRRMWVIGLAPMRRTAILWGKFFFSAIGSLLISGSLIVLSDLMLGVAAWTILVHMVVIVCVCCGLNGLAVGLGAVYPDLRTDNPSKIVSSFGGTLNLVCSIAFITVCVGLISVVLHFHAVGQLSGAALARSLAIVLGAEVSVGALACFLPMACGMRAFTRMEF